MKVSELYNQVAQLGFEDSLEDDNRFYYTLNRTLLQVCKVKPAESSYIINHKPPRNILAVKKDLFSPIPKEGTEIIFEGTNAKAYYFEAEGNGFVDIEKYNASDSLNPWIRINRIEFSSSGTFIPYKGFIKDGEDFFNGLIRLRFAGDYLYTIRNIALYDTLYGGNISDIPAYQKDIKYDIKLLVNDFLELKTPPILEDLQGTILNQGYKIENDSVILFPYENKGVYKILYNRKPTFVENTVTPRNNETVLDLSEELCALLPLLVSAYIWVDDEPEKAQYYMELYREQVRDIQVNEKNIKPVQIRNINGW